MWSSSPRDNWARLVEAVVKLEQIRQLCRQDSITTAATSYRSEASHFSEEVLSVSSFRSERISVSPPHQPPFTTASGIEDGKNARTSTRKLFSTLLWRMKLKDNHLDDIPALEASRFASNSSAPSSISIPSYIAKNRAESLPTPRSEAEILWTPFFKVFSFNELKNATGNFRPDSLLGEGGFGDVFKGWIDEHSFTAARPGYGLAVAVKKLKSEECQGHKEWLTEVDYLSRIHHPNIVNFIGYCCDGDNRLLVYEFMPNGSLENQLFGRGPQQLSWATRIKVAIGAARGLSFLHELDRQVVLRDFKPSTILLDGEFNSKLSGFGLAKDGPTGDRTHVSTQVMGTYGYAAPEYVVTGRLTAKCDVYSFGVVLLELLSGRRVLDRTKVGVKQSLVDWAIAYINNKRKLFRIMDIKLKGLYPKKAAFTAATIAVQCLSSDPKLRPRMAEVQLKLEELQAPKSTTDRHSTYGY